MGESGPTRVRVDGEEAVLHITEQSVMFEKGGRVSGFERSAIRMIKPDGDAMIVAYSAGSEVKSVRVEPMTAVASLLVSASTTDRVQSQQTGLDEVFDKLYRDTRRELEDKLAKVEAEPLNKNVRLRREEEVRYSGVSNQMESIAGIRNGFNPRADNTPISFWGLETQPYELQLAVVKIRHIRFLRLAAGPNAERSDVVYSSDEVWPEDWPRILEKFNLGNSPYTTDAFGGYVDYLKGHRKYQPTAKRPALLRS